jgi:hypothetical protein
MRTRCLASSLLLKAKKFTVKYNPKYLTTVIEITLKTHQNVYLQLTQERQQLFQASQRPDLTVLRKISTQRQKTVQR